MDVRNCPECGKIYRYAGRTLCPKCIEEDEKDFLKVKDYLRQNRGASIVEISDETDVEETKVIAYLREGRLQLVPGQTGIILHCERCNAQILSGRYCEACVKEVKSGFQQAFDGKEVETKSQIYKDNRYSQRKEVIHTKDKFLRRR